jgi:hypothetical protein
VKITPFSLLLVYECIIILGRGDWNVPEQFKAGLEAVDLLGAFYAKVAAANDSKL